MSQSPPWMPLSVDDYLADTGHLSTLEHGAYFLLILRYWKDRGLPTDEKMIARYARLTAEQWIESREVLAALFDEGWKHKRIEAELAKATDLMERRQANAERTNIARGASRSSSRSASTHLEEHLQTNTPSSVPDAEGARVSFDDVWEAFPQNPSSLEAKARKSFERIVVGDHAAVLAGAIHYAKWFGQDCETRGRAVEAGLSFVPHLAKWLDCGGWREALKLPLKGEPAPTVPMVRLDREQDHELWAACEKLLGKRVPTDGMEWSFTKEIVDQARAQAAA